MALDNMYVVTHIQKFLSEKILNVYTYEADVGMSAVDVGNAFVDDMLDAINALQGDLVTNFELKTYNLGDLGDNDDRALTGHGLGTGADVLPIFNAVGYSLRPASRVVRPGSKRYAGVPETVQTDGTIDGSGYLTAMETLRVAIGTPISDDDTLFATPIIIKRVKYAVPGSDPVRYAYRFPTIGETPVFSQLSAVLTNTKVTHQTSRGNNR